MVGAAQAVRSGVLGGGGETEIGQTTSEEAGNQFFGETQKRENYSGLLDVHRVLERNRDVGC